MVKQAKQLLYLLIPHPACPFFFWLGCVFVLVFEGGCINSVPTSPLSLLLPLHCSVLLLGCLSAYAHTLTLTHTRSLTLSPPSVPPSVSAAIRHRD